MQSNCLDKIKALVFPNRCIVCGKLCIDKYFCKECEPMLNPFSVKLCPKCGAPLKYCNCKFNFYYFDKITCVFPNEDTAQKSFHRFKFGSHMSSGNYFAQRMSASLVHAFDIKDINFITCVPMHIIKKLNRGYNQSEYLARIIAKNVGLPFENVLYEQKNNKTQHKQTVRNDRFLNVKNRYKVRTRTSFKGKTILIVDDIITTGATLSECARLLKLKGAEKVFCVTALKTLYKENNTKSDQTIEKPQTIL